MSQRLQFAAFLVAGPRYLALGAMALGHQPEQVIWFFLVIEIASWLGFAMLEGYAIPYIAKGIRRFPSRSFEWGQLQVYRALLLLAIPTLGAPLYLAISQGQTMVDTLGPGLFLAWAFLLTGMGALVIDAVGTCESVNEPEKGNTNYPITIRKDREGGKGPFSVDELARMYAARMGDVTPDKFIAEFEAAQLVTLTTEEAEDYLQAAKAESTVKLGRNGKG